MREISVEMVSDGPFTPGVQVLVRGGTISERQRVSKVVTGAPILSSAMKDLLKRIDDRGLTLTVGLDVCGYATNALLLCGEER